MTKNGIQTEDTLQSLFNSVKAQIAAAQGVTLPAVEDILDAAGGDLAALCLYLNVDGLAASAQQGAFQNFVHGILHSLKPEDVLAFIDGLHELPFQVYTGTTPAEVRRGGLSPIVLRILVDKVSGRDPSAVLQGIRARLEKPYQDANVSLRHSGFFLVCFGYPDEVSLKNAQRRWHETLRRIGYRDLFMLLPAENRGLIDWILAEGQAGHMDLDPKLLLVYFWTAFAYAPSRLESIRARASECANAFVKNDAATGRSLHATMASLRWISSAQINRISSPFPMKIPLRKGQNLRIALCVSGQMRGYDRAFPSWKEALRLDQVNYDLYLHTWNSTGRKGLTPHHASRNFSPPFDAAFAEAWRKGCRNFPRRYPSLFALFEATQTIDESHIRALMSPKVLVAEPDDIFPDDVPNTYRMHYKIEKAYELCVGSGIEYDLVVRLRPDKKFFPSAEFDWETIYEKVVEEKTIFSDIEVKVGRPHGLVTGDQMLISDPEAAAGLFRIWSIPAALSQRVAGGRSMEFFELGHELRQHVTFALLAAFAGRRIERLPYPIFGDGGDPDSLMDPGILSPAKVREALEKDSVNRNNIEDNRLLEFARQAEARWIDHAS